MLWESSRVSQPIRAAASVQLWTAEERDRYEADMARIMKTVQTHAVVRDTRAQLD